MFHSFQLDDQFCYSEGHMYRGAQKNGTQTTLNNFFVIWSVTLQFTHINFQHVQFLYIKGFFRQKKGKKVIGGKQNDKFSKFVIFFGYFF